MMTKVPLEDWLNFKDDSLFLSCLYAEGVDNWEGFENAIELYKFKKEELGELIYKKETE